jgi:hypothetical protein
MNWKLLLILASLATLLSGCTGTDDMKGKTNVDSQRAPGSATTEAKNAGPGPDQRKSSEQPGRVITRGGHRAGLGTDAGSNYRG